MRVVRQLRRLDSGAADWDSRSDVDRQHLEGSALPRNTQDNVRHDIRHARDGDGVPLMGRKVRSRLETFLNFLFELRPSWPVALNVPTMWRWRIMTVMMVMVVIVSMAVIISIAGVGESRKRLLR